mgnify:FL=1
MTFEQFKYVLEVAKCGSFNQAANTMFLSQSTLSTSIKNLEEELGQPIFFRNNRGIQLTSFGRDFISYITQICTQMSQLEQLCKQKKIDERITFSVSSNGFRFIAPICAKLYQRYRSIGIHIYHYDGIGDDTIEHVANQQVEIGIVRIWDCYKQFYMRQFFAKKLLFTPLTTVNICIMVGRGNPLFYQKQEKISVEVLADYPMVVHPNLHSGPFSDIFSRLGIPENKNRIIAGSRAIIYDTLENTDAYYVSSDLQQGYRKMETPGNLRSFLIDECPITSEIGWIRHEDYMLSPIAKEFIKELTWTFQDI